jgi:type VI secretion system protein ImpK
MKYSMTLLDCAVPIFKTLEQMNQHEFASSETTAYGIMLRGLLHRFEREAFEKQIPSHQVHDAKYALAALIDESILKSSLPEKDHWISQLIQVEQFGEHLAGENFFKWLERVKNHGPDYLPVLEVYYVCLKMGFSGRYAVEGQEKLNAIHVDVKHKIDLYLGTPDPRLSPRLESPKTLAMIKHHFPWWGYCAVASGLIFVVYLGYSVMLNGLISTHLGSI